MPRPRPPVDAEGYSRAVFHKRANYDGWARPEVVDPTGTQHVCCSAAHPEGCPQATHLSSVRSLSVWAEGVEGDFDLEIQSIGAGP